jgi:putative tricarboxylic transport membrane protein
MFDSLPSVLENLGNGLLAAAKPENLLFGFIGVFLGNAIGVLPGLGPAVAISVLLPLTFGLDPLSALIMFAGIYSGSMYGGSITSILVNTPGDSSSAVTTFDGHPMAKNGRAGAALLTSMLGSFVGGTFAVVVLMLVAPAIANVSLLFGPTEYFSLMLLALIMVSTIGGNSMAKSIFSVALGIMIAMIGIDMQSGVERMTFGIPELFSGIDVVLAGIGLFAVGEALWVASGGDDTTTPLSKIKTKLGMTAEEWKRSIGSWVRGTMVGFSLGTLPGTGGTLSSFMAYGIEKRISKTPEKFGQGMIEGVGGPEAANNASAGASMIPLLSLGIPGSATTAVMLVAFQIYGLQPGPLLFENNPELVWGLIASLYIGNILLLILNVPLIGLWTKLLEVPQVLLSTAVLVFAAIGAYSIKGSVSDILIVFILGVLAFTLRFFKFPIAPVLLGVVLGPMIEQEFRRALSISGGDYSIFVTRPMTLVLLFLSFLLVFVPLIMAKRKIPRLADEND